MKRRFLLDKCIPMFMFVSVGRPKQFASRITIRVSEEHVERLHRLCQQSGLDRNEVVRRAILRTEIASFEAFQGMKKLQSMHADQKRLGGLLKLALTGSVDRPAARSALAEVQRAAVELRALIVQVAKRL